MSSYFGGKGGAGVYQTLINNIPPHHTYIAGFAGHDAIFRKKNMAHLNFLIDPDPEVIAWWNDQYNDPGVHILEHSFFDFAKMKKGILFYTDTFLYLDPPYLHDTRKSNRDRYNFEMDYDQHISLLKIAKKLPCMVGISHYPCDLYDYQLREWRKITFTAQTRRGPATEAFYMNYDIPTRLHDYSYLGDDYKDRERIKLKFERWKNNLADLPPLERNMRIEYLESKK